jgi:hypothetical protein
MTNDLLMQTMTLTKDRLVLSSERVPHKKKKKKQDRNCQTVINIWSWAPDGGSTPRLTDWLTDWLTVSHNVTLTLTLITRERESGVVTRLEAGLNISTVTLPVIGGDKKRSLKSETVKYGRWVPWDSDPRKTALSRASSIWKRQTRPLVREGILQNNTVTVKQ